MLDIYTDFRKFRFRSSEIYEIFITEGITKFGPFLSEIRNEIWSFSNEIQAKASF